MHVLSTIILAIARIAPSSYHQRSGVTPGKLGAGQLTRDLLCLVRKGGKGEVSSA